MLIKCFRVSKLYAQSVHWRDKWLCNVQTAGYAYIAKNLARVKLIVSLAQDALQPSNSDDVAGDIHAVDNDLSEIMQSDQANAWRKCSKKRNQKHKKKKNNIEPGVNIEQ